MSKIFQLTALMLFGAVVFAAAQTDPDIATLKAKAASPEFKAKIAALKSKAANGDAGAQDALGWFYQFGVGLPQDYSSAIYWYRKAADQNLADAQFRLGRLYDKGDGVPKDYQVAAQWYRKAAEQGDVGAQYDISFLCVAGVGVPQDYSEAYFWAILAAANTKIANGTLSLENLTSWRDSVASNLTKSEILAVQERARKWSEGHATRKAAQ
ncbi:MAG: tetratricopeptide repeat protein [Terriglobia bacterium]|nr:tetratricopeptide repeat protein [Terriglobia bacterium]